jgi:hypothetical protein
MQYQIERTYICYKVMMDNNLPFVCLFFTITKKSVHYSLPYLVYSISFFPSCLFHLVCSISLYPSPYPICYPASQLYSDLSTCDRPGVITIHKVKQYIAYVVSLLDAQPSLFFKKQVGDCGAREFARSRPMKQ